MLNPFQKGKMFILLLMILINLFFINSFINSENIYFSTRGTFANSQFWEREKESHHTLNSRKVFTNFFSGSFGFGMEMEIWDFGIKRGSRIFWKTGIDVVFSGISYAAAYEDDEGYPYTSELNINGGCFYTGIAWDIFIGGTFPKTNLIWGFGAIWTFLFPVYSPNIPVSSFNERWHFYATPTFLLGYDIFIANRRFKLTPQMRVGFTCNPLIPHDVVDMEGPDNKYFPAEMYSGLYVDFSISFSFYSIEWKKMN